MEACGGLANFYPSSELGALPTRNPAQPAMSILPRSASARALGLGAQRVAARECVIPDEPAGPGEGRSERVRGAHSLGWRRYTDAYHGGRHGAGVVLTCGWRAD